MKYLRYAMVFILIFSVFATFVSPASAQKFSYVSGIQIQNLSSTTATVHIAYIKGGSGADAGTEVTSTDTTIPGNTLIFYFPIPVSGSFFGSVVISSDQPLAAISNILSSDYNTQASYVGTSTGSNTVEIPLLDKNNSGWDSWFSVQNVGTSDATVTVNYPDCATQPAAVVIKSGASLGFYQASETCHTKTIFPATITSTQPIAAVVVRETTKVMTAYTGFSSSSTTPVMPLINSNNSGIQTGVNIYNLSNDATDVTVSYTPSQAGSACTEMQNIPGKSMKTFALAAFVNSTNVNETCANGVKFIGAAKVTGNSANALLTAVVTQFSPTDGAMYGAFNPANATAKVVFPTIFDRRGSQLLWTSLAVMNVGASPTSVECVFTGTTYKIGPQTLQPGEGLNDLQNNKIAPNYLGGATCTATGGDAKIVGEVNEIAQSFLRISDGFLIYEGINLSQ